MPTSIIQWKGRTFNEVVSVKKKNNLPDPIYLKQIH
jgi:hypothetical protein